MNTCANCRHWRPRPPTIPWYSQRRAVSAACSTRTSHRVRTASRSVSKLTEKRGAHPTPSRGESPPSWQIASSIVTARPALQLR